MNDQQHDSELRDLFEAQRRSDASDAPPFADLMAKARAEVKEEPRAEVMLAPRAATLPARRARLRLEWLGGLAAAAAIAALVAIPRLQSGDDAFEQAVRDFQSDPALGAWQSPTGSLLNVPGEGLLTTVPGVGTASQ